MAFKAEELASKDNSPREARWAGLVSAALTLPASWRVNAPRWSGVGGGVLLVIVAALGRLAILGPSSDRLVYITFWPALVVAAVVGGAQAGATALIVSALLVHSVIIPLHDIADWLGLLVYLAVGGFTVGITELFLRARAQALAAEETHAVKSHLAAIVESSADAILSTRPDGTITSWNAAAARLFGYGAAEIIGQPITTLIPPKLGAENAEIIARIKNCERIDYFETARAAKNGRVIDVSLSASPIHDSDGEIAGASTIMRDITGRKLAEERSARDLAVMMRLQKLANLYVREDNFELVLEEIVDAAIAITGADFGTIQLVDPRSGDLRIVCQRGFPQWWIDFWNSASRGTGACGAALKRGERVIVEDVEQDPIFSGTPSLDIQRRAGVRAVQSTPLMSRSGRPLGMFSTHCQTPRRPDERSLRLLDLLGRQAADIIDRKRSSLCGNALIC